MHSCNIITISIPLFLESFIHRRGTANSVYSCCVYDSKSIVNKISVLVLSRLCQPKCIQFLHPHRCMKLHLLALRLSSSSTSCIHIMFQFLHLPSTVTFFFFSDIFFFFVFCKRFTTNEA